MKRLTAGISIFTFINALASLAVPQIAQATADYLSANDFMKVRCHLKGEPSWTHWSGQVTTSGLNNDKPKILFKIVGFNIARCYRDDSGNWMVSSRELTYFLDPATGSVVDTWVNPWTSDELRVVHIANDLVQQKIPADIKIPIETLGDSSLVRLDVPLSYPNPLAVDTRFQDYSPEPSYKAHESFTYVLSAQELNRIDALDSLKDVQVSWTRISPWMPWMKMKGASGYLVFNGIVKKVRRFEDIPNLIQAEIKKRLPVYLDAPLCIVAKRPNVTSWTYFKENFQAYLDGFKFPLSAPLNQVQDECRSPSTHSRSAQQ